MFHQSNDNLVVLKGSLIRCDAVPHLPLRVWDHFGLGFGPAGRFDVCQYPRPGSAGWQYKSFFSSKATLEGGNLPTACFETCDTNIVALLASRKSGCCLVVKLD